MPYIPEKDRIRLTRVGRDIATKPGELNYVITNEIMHYIGAKGVSYTTINDVIGALEAAKLEFYRRVAVPYEEDKIRVNGDIYP